MKPLNKQIEELIKNNVPKNIDLTIPVSQDKALQEYLYKTNEQINNLTTIIHELDKKVSATFSMTRQLMLETEQSRVESWFRSKKNN